MKIRHIIYDSSGNPWLGGGGAQRTQEIYSRLGGHDVLVLAGNFPGAQENVGGVRYKRLGFGGAGYAVSRLTFILGALIYLVTHKADVWIEDIGAPTPLVMTALKRRHIASVQFIPTAAYQKKRLVVGALAKKLFRWGLRFYRRIETVSDYSAEVLQEMGLRQQIAIVPNGVTPVVEMRPGEPSSPLLYLGRIDIKGKGLDTLLAAMVGLVKHDPAIKLMIAGGGERGEVLELRRSVDGCQLQQNVEVMGFQAQREKEDLLRRCSMLVLPSRNETSSLVVLEAFAAGRPVVATASGGPDRLVRESEGGVLTPVGDVEALKEGILRLREDRALYERAAEKGRRYAEGFSWENIATQHARLLEETHGE